ncbi:hypothetical protein B0T14DRAFT_566353 [Immersiella caudata]|uniref:Uncharacterized protein n=1 Tax=Immersiella caudata TaxID=314043 RepID=A0AA39WQ30_9PEZI|nr:hypothetical protein B0T14DRAFT_566353 [Immersiella caudata]
MLLATLALYAAGARSAPTPAPEDRVVVEGPGVTDHGKPNLVCFPASAMDIAVFFFINYLAHAASTRVPAGAPTRATVKVVIDSLCYPVLGVGYALESIAQWSVGVTKDFPFITLPDDSLETAHKAGALVTACREANWLPNPKDTKGYIGKGVNVPVDEEHSYRIATESEDGEKQHKRWLRFRRPDENFNIFGGRELPEGYGWAFVPWDVKVEPPVKTDTPSGASLPGTTPARAPSNFKLPEMPLGAEYSLFQPIAAVVQAISAGITLYRTRGDQLERYGFTAFGLTVVPYLVMSIVNFFANFAIPRYGALYIVQSDILDEATIRQGHSIPRRCVVGRLPPEIPEPLDSRPVDDLTNGGVEEKPPTKVEKIESGEGQSAANKTPVLAEEKEVVAEEANDEDDAKSHHSSANTEVIVSRFPSVELTGRRRPLNRLTLGILHWAIGLSSLVIIGIISKFHTGTETRRVWKNFFIVWLVFSCVSAFATTVAKNIYGLVLLVCLWVLGGIYHLFIKACGEGVEKRLESAKGWAKRLLNPSSTAKGHSIDAYDFFMFISEWVFFVLILVMVIQQLVDYGDCTYFRP